MTQAEKHALLALPAILLIALGLVLAGSQAGITVAGIPLFALGVIAAFVIQWIAFIPAYGKRTEKFFDLTGSITYLSVSWATVLLRPEADLRAYVLLALVTIWALRLGTFLFRRIQQAGSDERFDEIKQSFARFLMTWTLQGLWVSFTLAAALAAITSTRQVPFGLFAIIGLAVWLVLWVLISAGLEQVRQLQTEPLPSQPMSETAPAEIATQAEKED